MGTFALLNGATDWWEAFVFAFASFAGIWAIYWIILWLVHGFRVFYKVSNRQKRISVLWLGILIFVFTGLFPPYDYYFSGDFGLSEGYYCGFGFLFDTRSKNIAFSKLLIIWLAVTAVIGGLLYTLKDKKPKDN